MALEWAPSLEAILGARWQPLVAVQSSRLRGRDARPHVRTLSTFDGKPLEHVEWFDAAGRKLSEDSGSPAVLHHRRALEGEERPSPYRIAEAISEMLELPGRRSDYHFGMLSAWDALFAARRQDHRVFGWIEALCLADIALLEQGPEQVFPDDYWHADEERTYPVFPAFNRLASLYQREGFLAATVELERRAAALGSTHAAGENAIERQAALLEEDGR